MYGQQTVLNDRYTLLERAGSGGMATVYKAQDQMLHRLVAVKILHESLTGDDQFLKRFQREARAAANLSHPNIVTVHDIGEDHGRHFIVMEYVNGQTLKEIIRTTLAETGQPLSVKRTLDLGIQTAAGIGYAHRAGLVHCDVKPQNVLVTPDGRVKVADFGIARAMSQASLHSASLLWGTPHYFAPEQAAGEPASPASDVYAIGVILFEMLSGRLPFEAETLPALALKHLHEPPPPISDFNPAVGAQLEQIIAKVLSKEPSGRYRTAGQLERILRSYRQNSQQETGPVTPVRDSAADDKTVRRYAPIQERPTEIFTRPVVAVSGDVLEDDFEPTIRYSRWDDFDDPLVDAPEQLDESRDYMAVALGILAIAALLGLIPLWYFVARAWNVW